MTTYTVYYRVGGTENFRWVCALPVQTVDEARAMRDEIERGGRPAHYAKTATLDAIGLPSTFEPTGMRQILRRA